jgi:PAS domain S-box-containing protein
MFRKVSLIMTDLFLTKLSCVQWSTHGCSRVLSAEVLIDMISEVASDLNNVLRWLMIDEDEAGFVKLRKEVNRRGLPYELYRSVSIEDAGLVLRKVRFDLVVVAESFGPEACVNLRGAAGETPVFFLGPNAGQTTPDAVMDAIPPSDERLIFYVPVGVCVLASDGRWLGLNPVFCDALGYTVAELIGTDFQAIAHPADVEREGRLICQLSEGQIERYEIEKRYFHKNGQMVWAILDVSLTREEQGGAGDFIVNVQLLAHEIDALYH